MTAVFPTTCGNPKTCNKPTSVTDARGNTTTFTYASHGGVLTVTSPTIGSDTPQTRYSYAQKQSRFKASASTWQNGAATYVLTDTSQCPTGAGANCAGNATETITTIDYPGASTTNNLLPNWVEISAGNGTIPSRNTFAYDLIGNLDLVDGPISGTADTTKFFYDAARQPSARSAPIRTAAAR